MPTATSGRRPVHEACARSDAWRGAERDECRECGANGPRPASRARGAGAAAAVLRASDSSRQIQQNPLPQVCQRSVEGSSTRDRPRRERFASLRCPGLEAICRCGRQHRPPRACPRRRDHVRQDANAHGFEPPDDEIRGAPCGLRQGARRGRRHRGRGQGRQRFQPMGHRPLALRAQATQPAGMRNSNGSAGDWQSAARVPTRSARTGKGASQPSSNAG